MTDYTLDTLRDFVGRELGVSGWLTVDQAQIDRFAEVTGDQQWIHVDAERARREGPYGTTIAHGLLTLSLLPTLRAEVGVVPDDVAQVVNYGYDRVRFLSPVKSGVRIRARVVLSDIEEKGEGVLLRTANTVEVEGEDRPALVADALTLLLPG